ncbi:UDP-N-acetylmuramoyl-L-alanyl-D-glutamate--2,6-diaminopimelate ligase [Clostridium manihotivorum]|uniref:UDP-N-acetylmuramoyl-L-alanyl-D-glutamate--2,6-diaminopimelate ligase n=1 Tax=Clostridium manihotivorum TaxID=2320868 RepID=A0A3R5U6I2_9CLOT|nr:UDP-N-acetylmuramoyl-L-alanyl-D-glutamate--2,6-diaminopimelate ligase [Clostridium manihotivorum]QAA33142.1 UDP-N-acetylmuramoyl-L-alanyl-D-glutamate--2,6-diaminopimelate ligase [Clostridium manihotivorum]
MILSTLLEGIKYEILEGNTAVEVDHITWDSRSVSDKALFIAVKNKNVDRHDFILEVAEKGAVALIIEHDIKSVPQNITVIKVKDSRKAMSMIASKYFGEPMKSLKVIGITGTNGKTSTSYFIEQILEALKVKCGVIGTIQNTLLGQKMKTEKLNPTTPDSIELQSTFSEMVELGATHSVVEVTSSALAKDRVYGCEFDVGVFTNITQDHLEEHGTMENYKVAKLKLFNMCKNAVVNVDDPFSIEILASSKCKVLGYGVNKKCDFQAQDIEYNNSSVHFNLIHDNKTFKVELNVPGRFSVYNVLAAIASCNLIGFELVEVIEAVKEIKGVPGRFQAIPNNKGTLVIVDYAHTPDALKNILVSVKQISKGKIILVFGCGGNRDSSKRAIMGEIAGTFSDYCIVTSDNPRKENPIKIIEDIEKGLISTNCKFEREQDRKLAINRALNIAKPEDAVIIAGKGHESYQIIKDETIHFSDEEEVLSYFT